MKKKVKYIILAILIIIAIPVYIIGASSIIEDFIKPPQPFMETAGNYKITLANGETSPDDGNENRIFDLVNKNLFYSENSEFTGKQLIALYRIDNGGNNEKAKIRLPISEEIYNDLSITAVNVDDDNNCNYIESEKIIDENGEYYITFNIEEGGLFGILDVRGKAGHAWLAALISITVIVIIYLLCFIIPDIKKKGSKKSAG